MLVIGLLNVCSFVQISFSFLPKIWLPWRIAAQENRIKYFIILVDLINCKVPESWFRRRWRCRMRRPSGPWLPRKQFCWDLPKMRYTKKENHCKGLKFLCIVTIIPKTWSCLTLFNPSSHCRTAHFYFRVEKVRGFF